MLQYPNPIVVTQLLLKSLFVKHSLYGLTEKIEEHPEYPSLLAISDCLTEWKIANQAFIVEAENFETLVYPCILHLRSPKQRLILAHSFSDSKIEFSDEKQSKAFMSKDDFLNHWTGNVLYAEASDISLEPTYQENIWKERFNKVRIPLLCLILLIAIFIKIVDSGESLGYSILIVTSIVGVAITVLLLLNSIDSNNPMIQNLCSIGSDNGCNQILKSNAALLTSWLSWSEIGFFYFSGFFMAMLFVPASLPLLVLINFCTIPYTIYSVAYQYRKKNWCLLCCSVQVLLVIGSSVAFSFGMFDFKLLKLLLLDLNSITKITISFLLPILSWYALKPFFSSFVQLRPLKQQHKRFKYNSELFNNILTRQSRYSIEPDLMPVLLGNPTSENIITIVSNPFCGPCAKAHQFVDDWLAYRDDLLIKIIFSTDDDDNDDKTRVARHISALTSLNDETLLKNALTDWYGYSAGQYGKWAEKYPVNIDQSVLSVIKKQKEWCELAEIDSTPTILINGYKLPEPYRLEDIKYLIN